MEKSISPLQTTTFILRVLRFLKLEAIDSLKAEYFLDRRKLGILNLGDSGSIEVDSTAYLFGHKRDLYVGLGVKVIVAGFKS